MGGSARAALHINTGLVGIVGIMGEVGIVGGWVEL